MLKAFIIGNVIDNESEYVFIPYGMIEQFSGFINAEIFDIKDKDQVYACKKLLYNIKHSVLFYKESDNEFSGFMMAMAMQSAANTSNPSQIPQKSPTIPEIDQNIYKKTAAFDKLVEALRQLRQILIELTNSLTYYPIMKL